MLNFMLGMVSGAALVDLAWFLGYWRATRSAKRPK